MTSAEYLDIRVKLESMQQTISQTAIDINVIKCLLITEFAQKHDIAPQNLISQLYDIYNKHSKHSKEENYNDKE